MVAQLSLVIDNSAARKGPRSSNAGPPPNASHPAAAPWVVPPRQSRTDIHRWWRNAKRRWRLLRNRLRARVLHTRGDETGAVTAEYAIIIMAGVAFAGLLVAIIRSPEVRGMLVQLVQDALSSAG